MLFWHSAQALICAIHQAKYKIRRILLYRQLFVGIKFNSSVFLLYMTRTLKKSANSFLWNTIVGYILWIPSSTLSQSHSIPANILTFFAIMHVVNLSHYTPSFRPSDIPCPRIHGLQIRACRSLADYSHGV